MLLYTSLLLLAAAVCTTAQGPINPKPYKPYELFAYQLDTKHGHKLPCDQLLYGHPVIFGDGHAYISRFAPPHVHTVFNASFLLADNRDGTERVNFVRPAPDSGVRFPTPQILYVDKHTQPYGAVGVVGEHEAPHTGDIIKTTKGWTVTYELLWNVKPDIMIDAQWFAAVTETPGVWELVWGREHDDVKGCEVALGTKDYR